MSRRIALLGRFAIFAGNKSDLAIDVACATRLFGQQEVDTSNSSARDRSGGEYR